MNAFPRTLFRLLAFGLAFTACRAEMTVTNLLPGHTLDYSMALFRGACDPSATSVTITNKTTATSAVSWPALSGHYKGSVLLVEGVNEITLEDRHTSITFPIAFAPQDPNEIPELVRPTFIVPFDFDESSDVAFMAPSGETNDLESAKKRIGLAALMMQTFVSQSLADAGRQRETFRLALGANGLPEVEVIHSSLTRQELHDLQASKGDVELFFEIQQNIADSFISAGRADELNISVFYCIMGFTDYEYNASTMTGRLRGHTALGGGPLALFGSASLHTWPETFEEIPANLLDETILDETILFNDVGRDAAGLVRQASHWANYSTGLGASMHELGHCFDLPHTDMFPTDPNTGIMARGFDDWNMFFSVASPDRLVEPEPAIGPDSGRAEWHPLNIPTLIAHGHINPSPTIDYATWIQNFPSLSVAEQNETADPDKDGMNNFLEFSKGTNPTLVDVTGEDGLSIQQTENGAIELSYRRLRPLLGETTSGAIGIDFQTHGLEFGLEYSTDLNTWFPVSSGQIEVLPSAVFNSSTEAVVIEWILPNPDQSFIRLSVDKVIL